MIFVDSSFWIAVTTPRDAHHAEARRLVEDMADRSLVTSNHVRGETWTFLRARYGHHAAVGQLDRMARTPRLRIVFVPEHLERAALRWLRRHDERGYSFVDATSFALMRSMRIREALTFDGDFAAAGFTELRA